MRKFLVVLPLLLVSFAALADEQQTAGGWGIGCVSGNVPCNSGRNISCQSTNGNSNFRSECTQNTGNSGWVDCRVYDSNGNVINEFSDTCP